MKLNYRNFTRLGANFKGASFVPAEHVRKPTMLQAIELVQFLVSVGFLVTLFVIGFVVSVQFVVCVLLLVLWLASSILLAIDDYRYLVVGTLSGIISLVAVSVLSVTNSGSYLLLFFIVVLVVYLGILHLHTPSKIYYKWAKSVGA